MRLELDAPDALNLNNHIGDGPQLDDLLGGATEAFLAGGGTPLMLSVDDVDEDPDQPRTEFDAEPLRELADSILARGVLQPISVRPHPESPARWMVKIGARRLRACRLAGKAQIPAFVDAVPDGYAQVVENEQREGLTLLELALFVQRRLAAGDNQAEIARQLAKSRSYITLVTAMIDAPDWLTAIYRTGKCRTVKELYDLRRLHVAHGERVRDWLSSRDSISRVDVTALQERLQGRAQEDSSPTAAAAKSPARAGAAIKAGNRSSRVQGQGGEQPKRFLVLRGECDEIDVRVWLEPLPATPGQVFVSADDAQQRKEVAIESLRALRLCQQSI